MIVLSPVLLVSLSVTMVKTGLVHAKNLEMPNNMNVNDGGF